MPLRFYFDHNVPLAIAAGLLRRDVDVLRAFDDGNHDLDDGGLLARATRLGRVLFTHDDDFLALAQSCWSEGTSFTGIVYVHQGRLGIGAVIRDLEALSRQSDADDLADQVIFLPTDVPG